MSNYAPITGHIFCVRPKLKGGVKYYGAYPAGFLEKARVFLGVHIDDPVLHICAGYAHLYPYARGFGPNDKRLDLNPECAPDYLQDARDPYPKGFKAILADPPYSEPDAAHYPPGAACYPKPRMILCNALRALEVGQRVGILHYVIPRPPHDIPVKFVAKLNVSLGYDNRDRVYSVFEKVAS